MNNKGQVLVVFILTLPILLLMLATLIELGDLLVYKTKLDDNVKEIAEYGIKNIDDINLKTKLDLLNEKNLGGKAKIKIQSDSVTVSYYEKKQNIFSFITLPLYIDFSYKAYKENNKIVVEKE